MTARREPTRPRPLGRTGHRAVLEALARAQGLERFAFFDTTGEGRFYPNGMEETSGSVVDDRGHVFEFWTTWDPVRGEPAFRIWREVDPGQETGAGYRRAREAVGLAD